MLFLIRRRDKKTLAIVVLVSIVLCVTWYLSRNQDDLEWEPQGVWPEIVFRYPPLRNLTEHGAVNWNPLKEQDASKNPKPTVALGVVACGSRVEEAITMLKSAVIFSQFVNLHIVGVSDKKNQPEFARLVDQLRIQSKSSLDVVVTYEIYPTWFPEENHKLWRSMFLPCSAQRLFFPSMFPHIDSLLYIDSDALFLTNIKDLWSYFDNMNSKQLAAMAAEDEPLANGWYNINSKIPYYEPNGLNAGIMLMNLTRMRAFSLEDRALKILNSYYYTIKWADQDILNILFHFEPDYFFEISCSFNFRAQHCHCIYDPPGDCSCHAVKETGASILHGNRKLFHNFEVDTTEFLRDFYKSFKEYDLIQSTKSNLKEFYNQLRKQYDQHPPCQGASSQDILQKFEFYLSTLQTT